MATIGTTTNATPLQYPPTSLMDMQNNTRHLYQMLKGSTANTYEVYRSTNAGVSWSLLSTFTRASVVEMGPISVHIDGYLYWVFRTNESSEDRILLRRLNLASAAWGPELLLGSAANGNTAGAIYQGMDFKVFNWGDTYTFMPFAVATHISGKPGVVVNAARITRATGAMAVVSSLFSGTRWWTQTATDIHNAPALDYEHNGDNENGVPNLWVAFGPTDVRVVKMAWGANGWTGPSSSTKVLSATSDLYTTGRWDGGAFLIAGHTADTAYVYERNAANTATTIRGPSPVHPAGVIREMTLNYNAVTRDVRVYAVGTSSTVVYYCDYVRATDTWTSWGTVSATAVLGTTGTQFGVRRSTWGDAKHDVYTAHSGAPNTVVHTAQALSYAPNAPSWEYGTTGTTPTTNGQAFDVASSLTLDWLFSDPDDTDTQSAWALSRQVGVGALAYFRASDSTWQATEQKNTGTTTSRTLASAWGVTTDAPHTYKAKVWDAADLASSYSAGLVVIPSGKVNPTITAPANASTLTTDTVTVTWTVAEQTAYRVQLKVGADVVFDSGWVTGTETTYTPDYPLGDGFSYAVTLQTKNAQGLASTTQQVTVSVDFIEPATPTLTATPLPANGIIRVVADNPTPVGSQPAVSYQRLYRRPVLYPWSLVDGLETSLANWGTPVNGTQARVNTVPFKGSWALQLTASSTSAAYAESIKFPVTPGVEYWVDTRAAGPTTKNTYVQLRFYTAANAFISAVNGIGKGSPATNAYDPRWAVGTAPSNAATFTICLVLDTPAISDVAYWDEIRYRPLDRTPDTLVADGLGDDFTYDDWRAVSGVEYEYRAETHSVIGTTVGGFYYS